MTTLKDVADRANVSIAAASYALNGTGSVSEATRQRVLEAAEALNYHPNAFARSLRRSRNGSIGVFVTRFGDTFYEELLAGIHDAVLDSDYELIVCPDSSRHRVLAHRQVDGAIIFDSRIDNDLLTALASENFPIIVLDRSLTGDHIFPILVNNRQGVSEAFYHLYDAGARRIVFVSGRPDSVDNIEREIAFIKAAKQNKLDVRCFAGDFTEISGYKAAREIIALDPMPEAVICANDQMAIGFIRAMKEIGLVCPADIAVIGFDDIQPSRFMQPSLSTVGTSRYLWGSRAAAQLIDYLEKGTPFPAAYRIPTKLIPRESSKRKF